MNKNNNLSKLIPVMFTFFVMGFVDMVGVAYLLFMAFKMQKSPGTKNDTL